MRTGAAKRRVRGVPHPLVARRGARDARLSVAERMAAGKRLRAKVPRRSHGEYTPAPGRHDPVSILEEQGKSRLPQLVPIRYTRMLASPLAFPRRSAAAMAGGAPPPPPPRPPAP